MWKISLSLGKTYAFFFISAVLTYGTNVFLSVPYLLFLLFPIKSSYLFETSSHSFPVQLTSRSLWLNIIIVIMRCVIIVINITDADEAERGHMGCTYRAVYVKRNSDGRLPAERYAY